VSSANSQIDQNWRSLGREQRSLCPNCAKPMHRRSGQYGFWGCSGYRDGCKTNLPDVDGKPGERASRPAARLRRNRPTSPEVQERIATRREIQRGRSQGQRLRLWSCSNRSSNSTFKTALMALRFSLDRPDEKESEDGKAARQDQAARARQVRAAARRNRRFNVLSPYNYENWMAKKRPRGQTWGSRFRRKMVKA
jgi:ssDNA-binding Zn-finger/Zn-ribbon topoisomerase 1